MLKNFFGQLSTESDGGDEIYVTRRLIKIQKWLITLSILFYSLRNNKFSIKDVQLDFVNFDPIPKEEVILALFLIIFYLVLQYTINLFIYISVDFQERMNKLKSDWIKNFLSSDVENLLLIWRERLGEVTRLINEREGTKLFNEKRLDIINRELKIQIALMIPPVKRYSFKILFSEASIDALRFGIIIPIVLFSMFA